MNVLIFGATGSAGGSVLDACLASPAVREVRAVSRRPVPDHPKLRVSLHDDFADYGPVADAFRDLDACFFCLGVSATRVSDEDDYRRITRDFAVAAAEAVRAASPGAAFHFISGMGTRSDSRAMWARVKAEAEEDLMAAAGAVCFRPGFIDGRVSDRAPWYYGPIRPVLRLFRPFRSLYVSGDHVGHAMLQATRAGFRSRVVENAEIRTLAETWSDT